MLFREDLRSQRVRFPVEFDGEARIFDGTADLDPDEDTALIFGNGVGDLAS